MQSRRMILYSINLVIDVSVTKDLRLGKKIVLSCNLYLCGGTYFNIYYNENTQ